MTAHRLSQISADLVQQLGHVSPDLQRRVVLATCFLAVERAGVDAGIVSETLSDMKADNAIAPDRIAQISALAEGLDNEAWDIQERLDSDDRDQDEYEIAFAKARAVSSIVFALQDSQSSVLDSLYESYYGVNNREDFMAVIATFLG